MESVSETLSTVTRLKRRSRALRDQGDLLQARTPLKEAIETLEAATAERSPSITTGKESVASSDLRELSVQLADCYGSLGGIFRRQGQLRDALAQYRKGAALERSERFRIDNTYNQVNLLVTGILDNPKWLETPEAKGEAKSVLNSIERQISTSRREDPWAYCDAALLHALLGDPASARVLWSAMRRMTPLPSVYRSSLPTLKGLQAILPTNNAISDAVEQFATLSGSTV